MPTRHHDDDPPLTHRFTGSTRVDRGWYDPTKDTITVEFPDGVKWVYRNCSRAVWDAFINAGPAGHYINTTLNQHSNGPA